MASARSLTDASAASLDRAYLAKRSTARHGGLWVVLTGVALLALLASMQFYSPSGTGASSVPHWPGPG